MIESNAIEMKGVSKTYDMGEVKVHALNNINLEITNGDFVSLVGPSGSGKSTLLNMIGCIDVPDKGSMRILDKDTAKMSDGNLTKMRLKRIGFIFQSFYLIPTLSALENVELPMKELGLSRNDRKKKATKLLESVKMEGRMEHYPSQMSGGEQQRVAIARALANDPTILLADEPTGEVDSKTSNVIVEILQRLNEEKGMVVILVTHDLTIGERAKRMITMKDGGIVDDKTL